MSNGYELDEVLDALREADRLGEVEDAQRLAEIADTMTRQQSRPDREQPKSYMAKGFARGLGGITDLINTGLQSIGLGTEEPFGGQKSIERGFGALGFNVPEKPPETLGEHARAGVGEALSFFGPGIGVAKMVAGGTKAATGVPTMAANISKQILGTMARHPMATLTAEVGGGAGMGVGRKVGEEYPEYGPLAEMVGGVAGGVAPSALKYAPSVLGLRAAKWVGGKLSLPFSETGARYRAGDFLKKQVADPEATIEALTEESLSGLPATVMSGEKRLMALYNNIRNLDPVADAREIQRISDAAFKLQQETKALGEGSMEILRTMTEKRVASIELGMDARVAKSMEIAQRKVDALPVAQRQSQESIIVRNELTRVMKDEHSRVKDLWLEVPKETNVGIGNTQKAFYGIVDDLPTAQRSDIPVVLRNHGIFKEGVSGTTVNEMQGLRSKLLEVSRHARSNGQWNKARIADDVADAILEDIGITAERIATTPEGEILNTALKASKKFKQQFEQGVPGKVLGYDKTGAPSVAPEITLDIAMSRSNWVDIDKVAITPEARKATERYMARSFTDYTLGPDGSINPQKAAKWIQKNEELLDSFPDLRTRLSDIGASQELAINTKTTMDARKASLRDPKISVAGKFLGTDIGGEIKTILKSPGSEEVMRQLVQQARKDKTGEALEGLRGGFVEHILDKSSVGGFNDLGEKALSGKAMLGFINNNRVTLRNVFPQEQIGRMTRVAKELAKLETLEQTKGMTIEYQDAVSNMLKFASRFGGAAAGRHWGRALGAGGTVQIPGFFADQWHRVASFLTKNRFEKLINDAIMAPDGKLLESLLLPMDKPIYQAKNAKELNTRLNAWLMGAGSSVIRDVDEEGD